METGQQQPFDHIMNDAFSIMLSLHVLGHGLKMQGNKWKQIHLKQLDKVNSESHLACGVSLNLVCVSQPKKTGSLSFIPDKWRANTVATLVTDRYQVKITLTVCQSYRPLLKPLLDGRSTILCSKGAHFKDWKISPTFVSDVALQVDTRDTQWFLVFILHKCK